MENKRNLKLVQTLFPDDDLGLFQPLDHIEVSGVGPINLNLMK